MANPFTRSSATTMPNGPGAGTDNVASLANGDAKGLGSITTGTLPFADILVAPIGIKSGVSGVSGTASIYLIVSEDGTHWTGGIDPTSASDQSAALIALLASDTSFGALQTINMTANATTYWFRWFALSDLLTNIPSYSAVLLRNNSGAAFDATAGNHYAQYRTDSYA